MSSISELAEFPVSRNQPRIVVGVDGSESCVKALDWAIREAQRSRVVVEVVTAWTFPMVEGYAFTTSVDDVEKRAREIVTAATGRVAAAAPEVTVRGETADGEAGPILVNAAQGAEMLVVGTSGMGGLRRLFLGSVSGFCAAHATCSVVIVR
jgi:nucleotide-binding universal stress UspA family protein